MASATGLTKNDTTVLSMIFDPKSPTSTSEQFQPIQDRSQGLDRLESVVIESINKNDVPESNIREAISEFDQILHADATNPSAYNNRAQARRMLHNTDDLHAHPSDVRLILQDLNSAIRHASPTSSSTATTASQARVLAAAYTHRGYLYFRCARILELRAVVTSIEGNVEHEPSVWEEIASREFAMGGKYGNPLAKRMAVHTNPYAKLCGEMVKQAMYAEMKTPPSEA